MMMMDDQDARYVYERKETHLNMGQEHFAHKSQKSEEKLEYLNKNSS
jgi:hypothetical protein